MQEGKSIAPEKDPTHPRSAVGVSQDGRYVILLAVDGRQADFSQGATQGELAEWLIKLGAWSGLNLDGGGSTSLVIAGPDGGPCILNQPIHLAEPGRERPCPNHLGVFAEPLGR